MHEYPVKRGHAKQTDLKAVFEVAFGEAREDDGWLKGSFAALKNVRARYDGLTKLEVDTEQDRTADMEAGKQTIKAWNRFLEDATGYNTKQRGKKAQQMAKKEG
jgi:hypothetical protein